MDKDFKFTIQLASCICFKTLFEDSWVYLAHRILESCTRLLQVLGFKFNSRNVIFLLAVLYLIGRALIQQQVLISAPSSAQLCATTVRPVYANYVCTDKFNEQPSNKHIMRLPVITFVGHVAFNLRMFTLHDIFWYMYVCDIESRLLCFYPGASAARGAGFSTITGPRCTACSCVRWTDTVSAISFRKNVPSESCVCTLN